MDSYEDLFERGMIPVRYKRVKVIPENVAYGKVELFLCDLNISITVPYTVTLNNIDRCDIVDAILKSGLSDAAIYDCLCIRRVRIPRATTLRDDCVAGRIRLIMESEEEMCYTST